MDITMKKRGHMWTFEFRMPDGERKRPSTGLDARTVSEAEALEEAKRIARDMLGGAHVVVNRNLVPTLAAALEAHWRSTWQHMRSACTLKYVIPALQKENLAFLPITEVSTKRIREQIQKWQADGLKPATINRKLTAISTVLKIHEEDGDIERCPTIPYLPERNLKERYMTLDEERDALAFMDRKLVDECAEERPKWHLMRLAYIVLVDTGMRLGELCGLTEFNLRRTQAGELYGVWLKHGSTKTDKGRVIPLTPRAVSALEEFMRLRASTLGCKADQNWFIRRWQTVRTAIPALHDVNLHILRHTCASRLVEGGLGIYEVSQWLGHTDLKSTLRYAHLSPGRLSKGVEALEAVRMQSAPKAEGTSGT